MKLKEKLAKEYGEKSGDSTDEATFLEGFETAKRMCIEQLQLLNILYMDGNIIKSPSQLLCLIGEEEI